jgi:hypothetical protein
MRKQIDGFRARRLDDPRLSISPTLTLLGRLAVLAFDTARPTEALSTATTEPDERLEKFFVRNVRSISAINRQRGITTFWVGQLMNVEALAAEQTAHGWMVVQDKHAWPLIERLNGLLQREAKSLGDMYIDVPLKSFAPADFIDGGHFSPSGSAKFATFLAPTIEHDCR